LEHTLLQFVEKRVVVGIYVIGVLIWMVVAAAVLFVGSFSVQEKNPLPLNMFRQAVDRKVGRNFL
jgi:hypothetical protein